MTLEEKAIKEKAIAYWQDRLAKFFPTSKGPTNCEIEMFEAGYLAVVKDAEVLVEALKKIEDLPPLREIERREIAREALARWEGKE